jgi:hypothetical protein
MEVINEINYHLQTFQDFKSCTRNSAVECIIKTKLTGKAGQRNYGQYLQLYPSPDIYIQFTQYLISCVLKLT